MSGKHEAKQKNLMSSKSVKMGLGILLLLLIFAGGLYMGGAFRKPEAPVKTPIAGAVGKYAEDQDYSGIEESPSIAIPGYDSFHFKAGQSYQTITLHNPAENTCYFKMSLILEDETVIWTSDLLEPGMAFTSIELSKTLEAGTYSNVKLKYDCYSLKNQAQLNGAEIKVTIEVK